MSRIAGGRVAAVVALLLLPQQRGDPRGAWSAGQRRPARADRPDRTPSRCAPAVRLYRFVEATSTRCARCRSTSTRSTASPPRPRSLRRLLEGAAHAAPPVGADRARGHARTASSARSTPGSPRSRSCPTTKAVQNWYRRVRPSRTDPAAIGAIPGRPHRRRAAERRRRRLSASPRRRRLDREPQPSRRPAHFRRSHRKSRSVLESGNIPETERPYRREVAADRSGAATWQDRGAHVDACRRSSRSPLLAAAVGRHRLRRRRR